LRDVAVYYHFAISTFPVKIVIRSSAFILKYILHLPMRLLSNIRHGVAWTRRWLKLVIIHIVLEDFTTYCCWFNIGAASEDLVLLRKIKENRLKEAAPAGEQFGPPAPKTAKQLTAKRNQERVKSILLLAIPDEYLLKFHNVPDAKSLCAAIKSRFRGNDESIKMQRNVLKHHFENFTTAPNKSLDKAYDRFQKLISQLDVHAAPVSKEDVNQKFLRSLPPSWSEIALIMRNKPDID
ncbi:hypothetical protein Tco_1053120, partial [Tanacetum coccineum]